MASLDINRDKFLVNGYSLAEALSQHGTTVKTLDATDFIKDGMVQDVKIENGNLVIDFNTESGIEDISISLTEIFDPSNYYI